MRARIEAVESEIERTEQKLAALASGDKDEVAFLRYTARKLRQKETKLIDVEKLLLMRSSPPAGVPPSPARPGPSAGLAPS